MDSPTEMIAIAGGPNFLADTGTVVASRTFAVVRPLRITGLFTLPPI
jgi:hypothetical protein